MVMIYMSEKSMIWKLILSLYKDGKTNYVQVSLSVRDEATLQRELKPFYSIKDSFPKILITMNNAPIMYHDGIKQLFALDFLNGAEL